MGQAKQQAFRLRHRIENWREYNRALENRYSLTFWFDEEAIQGWYNQERGGQRGRPRTYSNTAIECGLVIKALFRLPLRGLKGYLSSIIELMDLSLQVPDISRFSRRQSELTIKIPRGKRGDSLHVVVDASGLKIHGDGEWKVKQHGTSRRRKWRKLHVSVDEQSKEITASLLTDSNVGDGTKLPDLLDQTSDKIHQVSADGAYDSHNCHTAISARGAKATIPPRKKTKITYDDLFKDTGDQRKELKKEIMRLGKTRWKHTSGYHRRSLVENTFFRFKTIFGDHLSALRPENQITEAQLKSSMLNKMTALGMPKTYIVMV